MKYHQVVELYTVENVVCRGSKLGEKAQQLVIAQLASFSLI